MFGQILISLHFSRLEITPEVSEDRLSEWLITLDEVLDTQRDFLTLLNLEIGISSRSAANFNSGFSRDLQTFSFSFDIAKKHLSDKPDFSDSLIVKDISKFSELLQQLISQVKAIESKGKSQFLSFKLIRLISQLQCVNQDCRFILVTIVYRHYLVKLTLPLKNEKEVEELINDSAVLGIFKSSISCRELLGDLHVARLLKFREKDKQKAMIQISQGARGFLHELLEVQDQCIMRMASQLETSLKVKDENLALKEIVKSTHSSLQSLKESEARVSEELYQSLNTELRDCRKKLAVFISKKVLLENLHIY